MGGTTIAPGSAARMMGSSLGRGGRVCGLVDVRSNLLGIISQMILPTGGFGFGRTSGGVVEENEEGNFVALFVNSSSRGAGDAG